MSTGRWGFISSSDTTEARSSSDSPSCEEEEKEDITTLGAVIEVIIGTARGAAGVVGADTDAMDDVDCRDQLLESTTWCCCC